MDPRLATQALLRSLYYRIVNSTHQRECTASHTHGRPSEETNSCRIDVGEKCREVKRLPSARLKTGTVTQFRVKTMLSSINLSDG